MIENYVSIICSVFSIAEFIVLVTLSGVLLTFSAFLNLLSITLTVANPLFLAIIKYLGKVIIYLMFLTVTYARSVIVTVKCTQLQSAPNIQEQYADIADIADIAATAATVGT